MRWVWVLAALVAVAAATVSTCTSTAQCLQRAGVHNTSEAPCAAIQCSPQDPQADAGGCLVLYLVGTVCHASTTQCQGPRVCQIGHITCPTTGISLDGAACYDSDNDACTGGVCRSGHCESTQLLPGTACQDSCGADAVCDMRGICACGIAGQVLPDSTTPSDNTGSDPGSNSGGGHHHHSDDDDDHHSKGLSTAGIVLLSVLGAVVLVLLLLVLLSLARSYYVPSIAATPMTAYVGSSYAPLQEQQQPSAVVFDHGINQ